MKLIIPSEILDIAKRLRDSHFEAYLVGGCVRDLLLKKDPKDWDIASNAKPQEILNIFPESIYKNKFGTVAVKTNSKDETLKIVEVTTFRKEGKYTDKRHPDKIKFANTIKEDLARRDFTINAMALNLNASGSLIDLYGGKKDLRSKVIRTVGDPDIRFGEDALRLMRAVRLSTELGFKIENKTAVSIKKNANLLNKISKERIRDELVKILMCENAAYGIRLLSNLNLMEYIIPELIEGIGVTQNKHHIYTVWEHNLRSLDYAAKRNYSLEIRLAALLHDVAKPQTKRGEGLDSTFYGHEIVGAKKTHNILRRLKFPRETVEKVTHLVRYHLFYYNVGEVTETGVRRFLRRVGVENVNDLIKLREADRIGSGVPKAVPYKLRHLLYMIEKVKKDPISPKMLAINGRDIMKETGEKEGPRIGYILDILLNEVIKNPKMNERDALILKGKKLAGMNDEMLKKLAQEAASEKEEFEKGIEEEMKKKYYVK